MGLGFEMHAENRLAKRGVTRRRAEEIFSIAGLSDDHLAFDFECKLFI